MKCTTYLITISGFRTACSGCSRPYDESSAFQLHVGAHSNIFRGGKVATNERDMSAKHTTSPRPALSYLASDYELTACFCAVDDVRDSRGCASFLYIGPRLRREIVLVYSLCVQCLLVYWPFSFSIFRVAVKAYP
jgi:hypothetical protein